VSFYSYQRYKNTSTLSLIGIEIRLDTGIRRGRIGFGRVRRARRRHEAAARRGRPGERLRESKLDCAYTPWRARQACAVGGFMGKPLSPADPQRPAYWPSVDQWRSTSTDGGYLEPARCGPIVSSRRGRKTGVRRMHVQNMRAAFGVAPLLLTHGDGDHLMGRRSPNDNTGCSLFKGGDVLSFGLFAPSLPLLPGRRQIRPIR
jgi:hypothetical protein